ncbi:unnamed protein product [Acanthoscelides obtectus]|uniref:Uncharacterized protein n=1 Tax=Acanthoscelides obtectus TaxID=200917 RepID=A0A9P0LZ98_ACAOB|nr:unnamed protein product [Acanthoscelides obtectus]CAK1677852.1 hypothetical protein AOBTE_LOCUS31590 [Acanthoscelides obtectus]
MAVKQWKHSKELIKDIKTKQDRYATKYKKEICNSKPRDLVMQLEESDLIIINESLNVVFKL